MLVVMKLKNRQQIKQILSHFNSDDRETVELYLTDVFDDAELYGVDILLSPTRTLKLDDASECNGLFETNVGNDKENRLSVAVDQPVEKWFPTFVHEASHMYQWIDQCSTWLASEEGDHDGLDMIMLWVNRKIELTHEQFMVWVAPIRDVELDCEKRVVNTIKKYNLPIDYKKYTRRANSYVWFYNAMWVSRQWYRIGCEPYNIPELLAVLPDHFENDYTTLPDEYLTHFIRATINGWEK